MKQSFAIRLVALLVACLLPLAAQAQVPAKQQGEQAKKLFEVRIGYVPTQDAVPLYVIKQNRWDTQSRILLKLVPMRAHNYEDVIASGKLDGFYMEPLTPLTLAERGVNVSAVAVVAQDIYNMVAAGPLFDVAEQHGFEHAILDYKYTHGRKPRISLLREGSQTDMMVRHWLKQEGIPFSHVDIVYKSVGESIVAMLKAELDAAMLPRPYSEIIKVRMQDHGGTVLHGSDFIKQGFAGLVLGFTNEFIEKNPKIVARIVKMNHIATIYAADPERYEEIAAFSGRYMGQKSAPKQLMKKSLQDFGHIYTHNLDPVLDYISTFRRAALDMGYYDSLPSADKAIIYDFYRMAVQK